VIYLDHHATTPVDTRVVDAMLPYFTEKFGNPASRSHQPGWDAHDAVERARKQVALLIGASAREVIFTSGATEANHLAIAGAAAAAPAGRRHIVTVVTEHKAVLDPCRGLAAEGWEITELPVPSTGLLDVARVEAAVSDRTVLVSVMLAHNEIGVVQPLADIARIAHRHGALLHSDAVQGLGKMPVDVSALGVDLASFSGHKLYGPKGVGALYVRRGVEKRLRPQVRGGGQERGLRGGTLNVPGIVGFGAACDLANSDMGAEIPRVAALRDRLWQQLQHGVGSLRMNGADSPRLAGNLNVSFDDVDGEALLLGISQVAVSAGAACATGEPSHVLTALGLDTQRARASLRFGLGRWTTPDDVDRAAAHIAAVVSQLAPQAPAHRAATKAEARHA
jgi:cysteine desulfurase